MRHANFIKAVLAVFALAAYSVPGFAQVIGKISLDTLYYSGKSNTVTDIVFLGDGYTSSDMDKFVSDVTKCAEYFFKKEPWKSYRNMFNVFYIKTESKASGAGMTPETPVNNYFGVTFGYAGVDRMPWPSKMDKVYDVMTKTKPDYDMLIILVNSDKYGGAGGGKIMCVSMDYWSRETICHEAGHAYADLADEYWYERYNEHANDPRQKDPVKWERWVNPDGKGAEHVGVYEFEDTIKDWYRPHERCLMRYLNEDYCAVCREAIVEKIHSTGRMLISYQPANSVKNNIAEAPATYSIQTVTLYPNTLRRIWTLDGEEIARNTDQLELTPSMMKNDYSTLKVTIEDTTSMVRVENHSKKHYTSVSWTVKYDQAAGITTLAATEDEFSVGPIPMTDALTFKSRKPLSERVLMEIFDTGGSMVAAGSFAPDEQCTLPVASLAPGIYLVSIHTGDRLVYSAKVIK